MTEPLIEFINVTKRFGSRTILDQVNLTIYEGEITTIIGKSEGNIVDVKVGRRSRDLYEMLLDVEVIDVEQLHRIMAALRTNPIVSAVERSRS